MRTSCLFLPVIPLLLALLCTGQQRDTGYTKITASINWDTANSRKARINAISNDVFKPSWYKGKRGQGIRFRLLSPPVTEKDTRYPLVLVLHSSGGIGADNAGQLEVMAKFWAQPDIQSRYPAFVLAPQFAERSANYTNVPGIPVLVSQPSPALGKVLELIDSLKKVLPVDDRRIYVMGFSMGASGVINCIQLRKGFFAAGVAISGIPAFYNLPALVATPLWIVHGNTDPENQFSSDAFLYSRLAARGHRHLLFWEVDRLEHRIYPELYSSDAIPKWLFKFHH